MIRPSLVDPNIFKKLSLKHAIGGNLVNNFTSNISNKLGLFFLFPLLNLYKKYKKIAKASNINIKFL